MIKTWRNGASGGEVKNIIDSNFNAVSKYLSKDIRALSTIERNLLSSDYLSENAIVFDTDEEQWYQYSKGSWVRAFVDVYTQDISASDWNGNSINILFSQHGIKNPIAQPFIKNGGSFIAVLGDVEIDAEHNVRILSDLPYDGKVVIK